MYTKFTSLILAAILALSLGCSTLGGVAGNAVDCAKNGNCDATASDIDAGGSATKSVLGSVSKVVEVLGVAVDAGTGVLGGSVVSIGSAISKIFGLFSGDDED